MPNTELPVEHYDVYPGLSTFDLHDVVFCLRQTAKRNEQQAAELREPPITLATRAVALMFEQQAERFTTLADRLDS